MPEYSEILHHQAQLSERVILLIILQSDPVNLPISWESALLFSVGVALGALIAWGLLYTRFSSILRSIRHDGDNQLNEARKNLRDRDRDLRLVQEDNRRLAGENQQLVVRERQFTANEDEYRRRLEALAHPAAPEVDVAKELGLAKEELVKALEEVSNETLRRNQESFYALAKGTFDQFQTSRPEGAADPSQFGKLLFPVKESLLRVKSQLASLEKSREDATEELKGDIKQMFSTLQEEFTAQTPEPAADTEEAGTSPWGEMQLQRVIEIAGMSSYCDYTFRRGLGLEAEARDLVVHLPADRDIIIDSGVPNSAFLESLSASTEEGRKHSEKLHARYIRERIDALSNKDLWTSLKRSPEFVVLFLAGESSFGAALKADPGLIEYGTGKSVILAAPTTLVALLRAVAFGWREQNLTENAREIASLGKELYERVNALSGSIEKLGSNLEGAAEAFQTLDSLEKRIRQSSKRLGALGDTQWVPLPPKSQMPEEAEEILAPIAPVPPMPPREKTRRIALPDMEEPEPEPPSPSPNLWSSPPGN